MKQDTKHNKFLKSLELCFKDDTKEYYIHRFASRANDRDSRFFRGNCPFCGFNDIDIEKDKHGKGWAVQCCNCGAVSPIGCAEKDGALQAWNFGANPYYRFVLDKFAVIGAMATTGGDAEEAARLLGVTVDFINERF